MALYLRACPLRRAASFRLIPAATSPKPDAEAAFLRLADKIQERDHCRRVEALQRAVDQHPNAFASYVASIDL